MNSGTRPHFTISLSLLGFCEVLSVLYCHLCADRIMLFTEKILLHLILKNNDIKMKICLEMSVSKRVFSNMETPSK